MQKKEEVWKQLKAYHAKQDVRRKARMSYNIFAAAQTSPVLTAKRERSTFL